MTADRSSPLAEQKVDQDKMSGEGKVRAAALTAKKKTKEAGKAAQPKTLPTPLRSWTNVTGKTLTGRVLLYQ